MPDNQTTEPQTLGEMIDRWFSEVKSVRCRPKTNKVLCGHSGNTRGYAFFNPDTGMEWSANHPRDSGEVDDATAIRPMRFCTFRRQYMDATDAR